jgi:hypothetical protein
VKAITGTFSTGILYNNKFYRFTYEEEININDIVVDVRDNEVYFIRNEEDIAAMYYVAPELYVVFKPQKGELK